MSAAVARLVEVCVGQFGMELKCEGSVTSFDPCGLVSGARISLIRPGGAWEIGLLGSKQGCTGFTREVLAHEDDDAVEPDEIVDVLGEAVNMVGGLVKRGLGREAAEVQIGVPFVLEEADCAKLVTKRIPLYAQRFASDLFEGCLTLVWSDRSSEALLDEIVAHLTDLDPSDRVASGHILALFEEFDDSWRDQGESAQDAVSACTELMLGLINDAGAGGSNVVDVLSRTALALGEALSSGPDSTVPDPRTLVKTVAPTLAKVERDDEMVELIEEFMAESEEGLDKADGILMEAEQAGATSDDVGALFRVFHTIKGTSGFLDFDEITSTVHLTETLLDKVRNDEMKLHGFVLDLVFESTEIVRALLPLVRIAVDGEHAVPPHAAVPGLNDRLQRAIDGETVVAGRGQEEAKVVAPVTPAKRKPTKIKPTMKVEEELVERLELLLRSYEAPGDGVSRPEAGDLMVGLREITTLIRMVPVAGPFQKMARMVRDLAKKTGKLIRLVVDGQDTKIGRDALEKVSDPLVHMIRNAVDHGIEDPEARALTDKPAMGTVQLRACHEDGNVVIELVDDGKGLDKARILEKAISKGIVEQGATMEEDQIFELIFEPGFSTAAAVTSISGRGVGMDVVRRNIEATGGKIQIRSTLGSGTTFRLLIPFRET